MAAGRARRPTSHQGRSVGRLSAEVGAIVSGTVARIAPYGAFIRLESGETGLVHISEIDRNYVRSVEEHLRIDDPVTVKVVGIKEDGKIDLSIKQADPTWQPETTRPRRGGPRRRPGRRPGRLPGALGGGGGGMTAAAEPQRLAALDVGTNSTRL